MAVVYFPVSHSISYSTLYIRTVTNEFVNLLTGEENIVGKPIYFQKAKKKLTYLKSPNPHMGSVAVCALLDK